MDFVSELQAWENAELFQGKIMIGIGIIILIAYVAIFRGESSLLKGMLFPLTLVLLILIGYGAYILQSRPAHVKASIEHYQSNPDEAIVKEIEKHVNDNKAGKTLLKVYPILLLLSAVALFFAGKPYYKGMAIGFALLFITTNIMDYGFVSRSEAVIEFLEGNK